jgi:hypothetical protein
MNTEIKNQSLHVSYTYYKSNLLHKNCRELEVKSQNNEVHVFPEQKACRIKTRAPLTCAYRSCRVVFIIAIAVSETPGCWYLITELKPQVHVDVECTSLV